MKSVARVFRIALVSLALLPFYQTVSAQDAEPAELAPAEKPLAIIRFTEQVVPFEGALKRAVAHAESSAENPFYDIVSVYPDGNGYFTSSSEEATPKAQVIVDLIKNLGVPDSRIRLTMKESATASYQEVHVFLR